MVTATRDSQGFINNLETAKDQLRRRFEALLARTSDAVLFKAVTLADDKAFVALTRQSDSPQRSVETRNQEAMARMKARAFERVNQRCELLDAREAYEILGISKQALSKKTQAGQVLAYTNTSNRRKYYPAFQFVDNKPKQVIAKLIEALEIDPGDSASMNFLIQHLISTMDYSNPGEPANEQPRHALLDDNKAFEIIKRDYLTAFEMGQ